MWYIFVAFLFFLLILSASTAVLCKKAGLSDWKQAFIPLWSFHLLYKLTGEFKVFSIPVKKYFLTMVIYFLVIAGCFVAFAWGKENLTEKSYGYFKQVIFLPLLCCFLLFDFTLFCGTKKLFIRFYIKENVFIWALTFLLIPVPILYLLMGKNGMRTDKEMY